VAAVVCVCLDTAVDYCTWIHSLSQYSQMALLFKNKNILLVAVLQLFHHFLIPTMHKQTCQGSQDTNQYNPIEKLPPPKKTK
jgi:hypothetical protein